MHPCTYTYTCAHTSMHVYMRTNTCIHAGIVRIIVKCWRLSFMFSLLRQVCLTHLNQRCLTICGWEVPGQEIHQYVCLPLIGHRQEVPGQEIHQDVCLPLIGPNET